MDHKEKYEQALERARKLYERGTITESLGHVFPELKKSEDEKISKEILDYIIKGSESCYDVQQYGKEKFEKWVAWLEKQGEEKNKINSYKITFEDVLVLECAVKSTKFMEDGDKLYEKLVPLYNKIHNAYLVEKQDEQKTADKVEPKFHVGDWVVLSTSDGEKVVQIDSIEYFKSGEPRYVTSEGRWFGNGTKAHLWTIQDAKPGDILAGHESFVIFKEIEGLNIKCYCTYHYMGFHPSFYVDTLQNKTSFSPATKEQCDRLFQKIKEADYEWDTKELKLKTIEQKYDIPDNDSERNFIQCDDRDKELSLSLQIQAYLNTASDELYASGKPLCSEKHIKDIHKCMLMWKKLHDSYFHCIYTWSEEDEKKLNAIYSCVNSHYNGPAKDTLLIWLKSLRPQND